MENLQEVETLIIGKCAKKQTLDVCFLIQTHIYFDLTTVTGEPLLYFHCPVITGLHIFCGKCIVSTTLMIDCSAVAISH